MGPKVQKRQKVFVAYSGSNPDAAKAIFDGARAANTRPLSVIYEPWQFADNSGRPIISPIIESIDDSPFLVADITVLSLNVVYEVGYAIGRRKRVKLLRYSQHAEGNLEQIGIFDTLGYSEFTDSDDVTTILSGDIDDTPLTDATTIDKNAPIYIVQPPTISTADVVLVSRIKKAGF